VLKLTEESLQKKYIMAECCHPIPGDDVLGYVDGKRPDHYPQTPMSCCRQTEEQLWQPYIATEWDTHKELSFLYIYI
jgi:GTP pyrophosphokinase